MQVIDNIKEVLQALNTTAVAASLGPIYEYLAQVVLLPRERENVHLGPCSQDEEDHKDLAWSIPRKRSHTLSQDTVAAKSIVHTRPWTFQQKVYKGWVRHWRVTNGG